MEPCRACTDRESQQQDHGTQSVHDESAVMVILCSRLYNPEEGGAGEVCIPLTRVMILMGAERSQESIMEQVCDLQHLCLHVRLPISAPNMGCLPPRSNAHKVFCCILWIVESKNLFLDIR
jgi:hypothetical protein